MSARSYRYHRAVAEAAIPPLPADHPDTNPQTDKEIAALAAFLFLHTRRAYRAGRSQEAEKYHTPDTGSPDAADQHLRSHAATVAVGVAATLKDQLATADRNSGDIAGVVVRRDAYKPDQIWQHEIRTADQQGMRDYHADHPWLDTTAHVEPLDAAEPICQDAIALGSIPVTDIDVSFPAHVGCIHEWVSDGPWGV